jgi:hypothetical protein
MNRLPISPLFARALDVAEKHLGIEELCRRLDVIDTAIQAWRLGHAEVPDQKFLQLVDILTQLDPSWLASTRKK